jgi:putative transposase
MAGFALRKNMVFDWNGVGFRIDRLPPDGMAVVEHVESGAMQIVPTATLLAEYRAGCLSARSLNPPPDHPARVSFSRPLSDLPPHVLREVVRRKAYVDGILEHGAPVFTPEYLCPLIEVVAQAISDNKSPSATTAYRWYCRLHAADGDIRALIPRFDRRGSRLVKQSARVLEFAAEAIEEVFKASPAANGRIVHTRLVAKVDAANRALLPSEQLTTPCLRTTYRLLKGMDAYDRARLKEGKRAADRRFTRAQAGIRTECILERVEVDHTPLDLFLIDERTWMPCGRPTLTVAIDHFSRMPLGYHLSYSNPSSAAVMGALRHAILPKQAAPAAIPELKVHHEWPCYGRPDALVLDNGLEFHGKDLDLVAMDLGIRLQFCPKRAPQFKGVIERYLKTINYHFVHQLPGTSLAKWHKRGDYDPLKHAILTTAEFSQIFEKWILDVYAQNVHRGIKTSPWAKWQEGLQKRTPELPESLHALQRRIGLVKEAKLGKGGIELKGLRYNGPGLDPILRACGPGTPVRVLFDPEDLGEIQVWGPHDADPAVVLAVDQAYARGLTLRQHEWVQQYLRERAASVSDPAAAHAALDELHQAVQALVGSRRLRERRRSAALRGISSSKPETTPAPSPQPRTPKPPPRPPLGSDEQVLPPLLSTFQLKRRGGEDR